MATYSTPLDFHLQTFQLRNIQVSARLINLCGTACSIWALALLIQKFIQYSRYQHNHTKAASYKSVTFSSQPRPLNDVEPIRNFDFRKVEPNAYRPFHSKAHVKMGISKMSRNDWIKIDKLYLNRINRRKFLLKQHPEFCIGSTDISRLAIREVYEEIMINHLPKRFPTIFSVRRGTFTNHVTKCKYSVRIPELDDKYMLHALAENVEEDFYFMVPDAEGDYRLQAYSSCFPQGLLSSAKMGLSVRQIHQPVPGYESRLGNGVDKHFRRMEPGQFVGRLNWSLQTDGDELFRPLAKNTGDPDAPSSPAYAAIHRPEIDLNQTYLRCEHHTLTCLPRTRTVMFCVRSYLTPIQVIKDEGTGVALAEACESMPEKFGVYKRRPLWGEQLCGWLREGSEQAADELRESVSVAKETDGTKNTL